MKKIALLLVLLATMVVSLVACSNTPTKYTYPPTSTPTPSGPTSTPTATSTGTLATPTATPTITSTGANTATATSTVTSTPTFSSAAPAYIGEYGTADDPHGMFLSGGVLSVAEGGNYVGAFEEYDPLTGTVLYWGNAVVNSSNVTLALNNPVAAFVSNASGSYIFVLDKVSSASGGATIWTLYNPPPNGPTTEISYGTLPFKDPSGMTQDSSGDIYVADTGNKKVEMFWNNTGLPNYAVPLHQWTGNGIQNFIQPYAIACDAANNVYVGDAGYSPSIIQEYTAGGVSFIGSITTVSGCVIKGMAIDPTTGNIFVADSGNHQVEEYTSPLSGGNLVRSWGIAVDGVHQFNPFTPTCIALYGGPPYTNILVGDAGDDQIVVFGP